MAATMLGKIQRRMINAAPTVLAVVGLSYYLLSGHDSTFSESQSNKAWMDSAPAVTTKEENVDAVRAAPPVADDDRTSTIPAPSRAYTGWSSRPPQPEGRISSGKAQQAPVPQKLMAPERLVTANLRNPNQEQIADVNQRAVHGATVSDKAAALMQLAAMGGAGALDTLSEAMADPDAQVRLAAVTSASRLARFKGDESGDIRRWLTQAGSDADPQVAEQARSAANELSLHYGEPPPFP